MSATSNSHPPADRELLRVLRDDGTTEPELDPFLSGDELLNVYRWLLRTRALDERLVQLQRQGRVGFYGSCTGQEAVPVAAALAAEGGDWFFPALRESAAMLVRGFPLQTYLAQIFGNQLDSLRGRQMPSHMSGRAVHQVSWSSCVGTQLPQAVGAAWAAQLRGEPRVVLGFLGDGATSTPDFHSALTFAGVFRPPVVLVCQNNQLAISTPTSRQSASRTVAMKSLSYGVPSIRVDGNDVLAVFAAVRAACHTARAGCGPSFIECVTYRVGPHSTSDDPSRYRDPEQHELWRKRDPLQRLRGHLAYLGLVDEAKEQAWLAEIAAWLDTAIAAVEPVGPPPRESLFEDVFADLPWHLSEQRAACCG